MRLCAIVWLVVIYYSCLVESVISGPFPRNVIRRIDSTVEFTCSVNTSLLTAGTFNTISWTEDGVAIVGQATSEEIGDVRSSTVTLTVTEENLSGVLIQCSVIIVNPLSQVIGGNATLITYGPPQAVSNLTSMVTQSSDNALILSWSAPSSPVQLHYTVTANISTTIRMTNNTNITITREEVMTALNSSECDYYTFHVIASNPAGNSTPANLTTPVTFVPAPDVNVTTSNNGSTLFINVVQSETDLNSINVTVELRNCTNELSYTDDMPVVGNNSYSFNVTDPQNWTSITVIAENQCRSTRIPVNFTAMECPTSTATGVTTPTARTITAISPLPSETTTTTANTETMPLPVLVTVVAIVVGLAVLIIVAFIITGIGGYCLWRTKRNRSCYNSSVTPVQRDSKEQLVHDDEPFKQEKLAPMPSGLPEYATPADARKMVNKQQQISSRQGTLNPAEHDQTGPEYAQPSVLINTKPVVDIAMYSDVWSDKANSLRETSQTRNSKKDPPAASPLPPPPPAASSLPPPPPPSLVTDDEYSNLQHDLGALHQVPPVDQDQHVYDSAQGEPPQYSSIAPQKKTKYTDVQFSPDAGLTIQGNTNTVQYSVVGDTPNMEYSVVGPKTNTSQDCPPPPPPPSADVVRDMMNH